MPVFGKSKAARGKTDPTGGTPAAPQPQLGCPPIPRIAVGAAAPAADTSPRRSSPFRARNKPSAQPLIDPQSSSTAEPPPIPLAQQAGGFVAGAAGRSYEVSPEFDDGPAEQVFAPSYASNVGLSADDPLPDDEQTNDEQAEAEAMIARLRADAEARAQRAAAARAAEAKAPAASPFAPSSAAPLNKEAMVNASKEAAAKSPNTPAAAKSPNTPAGGGGAASASSSSWFGNSSSDEQAKATAAAESENRRLAEQLAYTKESLGAMTRERDTLKATLSVTEAELSALKASVPTSPPPQKKDESAAKLAAMSVERDALVKERDALRNNLNNAAAAMGAEEGQLLAVQKERDHFREELGSATQLAAAAHSKHAMELEELQARVDQLEMDGEVLEEEAAGLRKKLAAASKAGGDSKGGSPSSPRFVSYATWGGPPASSTEQPPATPKDLKTSRVNVQPTPLPAGSQGGGGVCGALITCLQTIAHGPPRPGSPVAGMRDDLRLSLELQLEGAVRDQVAAAVTSAQKDAAGSQVAALKAQELHFSQLRTELVELAKKVDDSTKGNDAISDALMGTLVGGSQNSPLFKERAAATPGPATPGATPNSRGMDSNPAIERTLKEMQSQLTNLSSQLKSKQFVVDAAGGGLGNVLPGVDTKAVQEMTHELRQMLQQSNSPQKRAEAHVLQAVRNDVRHLSKQLSSTVTALQQAELIDGTTADGGTTPQLMSGAASTRKKLILTPPPSSSPKPRANGATTSIAPPPVTVPESPATPSEDLFEKPGPKSSSALHLAMSGKSPAPPPRQSNRRGSMPPVGNNQAVMENLRRMSNEGLRTGGDAEA